METTILLNGNSEVDSKSAVVMSVNWQALMPTIESFVRLRPDEAIVALSVNETDIRVMISRKRGRKNGSKNGKQVSENSNVFDAN